MWEGEQYLRNMERPNVDDRGGDDVTTTLTASSSPSTRRRRRRIHGGERGEGGGGSGSGAEDKSQDEEEALIADRRRDRCKFFRNKMGEAVRLRWRREHYVDLVASTINKVLADEAFAPEVAPAELPTDQ